VQSATGGDRTESGSLLLSRGAPDPAYFRTITVVIDETTEVRLRRRDRRVVPVAAGEHVVQATIDWTTSLATRVVVQPGEQVPIRAVSAPGSAAARIAGDIPSIVLTSDRPLYPVGASAPGTPTTIADIHQALARGPRPETPSRNTWLLGYANLIVTVAALAWSGNPQWLATALDVLFVAGWVLGATVSLRRNARHPLGSRLLACLPGVGVLLAGLYIRQRQRAFDSNGRAIT